MNKRFLSNIFRHYYVREFRKGHIITIIPSYECNFRCSYCARNQYGDVPKADLKSLEDWKYHLKSLDTSLRLGRSNIKAIIFNGGEPTILPYFNELADWILDQGWMLDVFTNLSKIAPLLRLRQTHRLIIHASHHPEDMKASRFISNWKKVDKMHRVEVREMGERRLMNTHKKTHLFPYADISKEKESDLIGHLRIDPNLNIYFSCEGDVRANIKQ